MNLNYTIFLYLIILLVIFCFKPTIFELNTDNKKRKFLYLIFLVIIIAIISFYSKVLIEWFL